MGSNKRVVVLIDAYGAAQAFPKAFNERGFACVHICTSPNLKPLYDGRFDASQYIECVEDDGDKDHLIKKLSSYPLQCILPGMEPGVMLADFLSEHFGLLSNGTEKSAARRNKFLMAQVLAQKGIPVIPFFKSANYDALLKWRQENCDWPVVIKPLDSAGIEGLKVCHNEQEIRNALEINIGKVNLMAEVNRELLIQPFIEADEYVVNHVSYRGRHFLTDISRNNKKFIPGVGIIYEREDLLEFEGPVQNELRSYVERVLDALDIKNGPSHAEAKYAADGPLLVEIAARVTGTVHREIYQEYLGHNPIDLTADVYTDPQKFLNYIQKPPKIKKHSTLVFAPNKKDGVVQDIPLERTLEKLRSLRLAIFKVKRGVVARRTTDLNSSLGFFYLVHPDCEVIEADYQRIQDHLQDGVVVEPVAK